MSDDDEFDTDIDGDDGDGSKLVKDLRRQLKEANKRAAEADAVVAEANKVKRSQSVAEALRAKGVRPELAKFYTNEDASADAVGAWVTENAELFGIDTDSGADDETVAAADAVSRASASAPPQNPGSAESMLHDLRTLSRAELVAKGYLPPNS